MRRSTPAAFQNQGSESLLATVATSAQSVAAHAVPSARLSAAITAALFLLPCAGQAEAQDSAASTNKDAAQTPLEEVVVTGIRGSLQVAQEIKRDAGSVVEAITLQDLGKFADSSIADALQRVPGVNITKSVFPQGGDHNEVSIRGLGPDFSSTTVNGREVVATQGALGDNGRAFDFGSVAPEVLSGVVVYKTSEASLVEPGLAGQVDMRTLRPLDYSAGKPEQFFGSVSYTASQFEHSGENGERESAIIGAKLFDDTLGFYVSALHSKEFAHASQFVASNSDFSLGVANANGSVSALDVVYTPVSSNSWLSDMEFTQNSVATAIQWRPTDSLEVNADYVQAKSSDATDSQVAMFDNIGLHNLSEETIAEPGGVVVTRTGHGLSYFDTTRISDIGGPEQSVNYLSAMRDRNQAKNSMAGLNLVWRSAGERLIVSADAFHNDAESFSDSIRPYVAGAGIDAILDARGNAPRYTFISTPDTAVSNPDTYTSFAFADRTQRFDRSERNSFRLDLEGSLTSALTVKLGARYSRTNTVYIPMFLPGDIFPTNLDGYFTGNTVQLPGFPVRTPEVSMQGFCGANPEVCSLNNRGRGSAVGPLPRSTFGRPGDTLAFSGDESYAIEEENKSAYAQLNFQSELFGLDYTGNVGLRAVQMSETGFGFTGTITRIGSYDAPIEDSSVEFFSEHAQYWKYLPSLNLTLQPRDNINLRFGASKTMSLPSYDQMAPRGTLEVILPEGDGTTPPRSSASVYGVKLKPTSAKNYDITGEYYTSYGGAYIVSVFYKDVEDLIVDFILRNQPFPGFDQRFNIFTTINAATGHTSGFEIGTNQPFTFLPAPWDGFGLQGNYTHVDSATNVTGERQQFVGSSKHNVNVNAYFEKAGFAARVAYSYRSDYLLGYEDASGTMVRGEDSIDLSISQKFADRYEVIFTASNLAGKRRYDFSRDGAFSSRYFDQPRLYSLGFRVGM